MKNIIIAACVLANTSVVFAKSEAICLEAAKTQTQFPLDNTEEVQYLGHVVDVEAQKFGYSSKKEFYLLDEESNLVVGFFIKAATGECSIGTSSFGPTLRLPKGLIAE